MEDLRDLARGIYPPLLADKGLVAALEAQARKAAVPTRSRPRHRAVSQDVESTVYFCTLEALNNVAKYADATRAAVRLTQTDGQLAFEVDDDGAGFDRAAHVATGPASRAWPTASMRSAGRSRVASAPGAGTTVDRSRAASPGA